MKKSEIECNHCKENTEKRILIERKPLEKIDVKLPDGYEEFICRNIIKSKRKILASKWIEEECRNRLLVKKIKV